MEGERWESSCRHFRETFASVISLEEIGLFQVLGIPQLTNQILPLAVEGGPSLVARELVLF